MVMSGMEFFRRAKVVRLRSHHDKYLLAEHDQEGVYQDRIGHYKNAKWTVEIVDNADLIRLKSCYGKYLTASNMPFLLGSTGKKVVQTLPTRLNSSLDWEPIREGMHVRLRTRYGNYLRANGGLPPWRNSVTHDIPHRTKTTNWILWEVDLVEIRQQLPKQIGVEQEPTPSQKVVTSNVCDNDDSASLDSSPPHSPTHDDNCDDFATIDFRSSIPYQCRDFEEAETQSPVKEGRVIFYNVGDENGDVPESNEERFFIFRGSSVEELKEKLKEETGHDDIVVCCRNPFTAKLYPLRLQLPPNNTDMHVVTVPSSFQA